MHALQQWCGVLPALVQCSLGRHAAKLRHHQQQRLHIGVLERPARRQLLLLLRRRCRLRLSLRLRLHLGLHPWLLLRVGRLRQQRGKLRQRGLLLMGWWRRRLLWGRGPQRRLLLRLLRVL